MAFPLKIEPEAQLDLFRAYRSLGIAQADAGDVIDHDQFMAELEQEETRS